MKKTTKRLPKQSVKSAYEQAADAVIAQQRETIADLLAEVATLHLALERK